MWDNMVEYLEAMFCLREDRRRDWFAGLNIRRFVFLKGHKTAYILIFCQAVGIEEKKVILDHTLSERMLFLKGTIKKVCPFLNRPHI